jgi:DNA-binding SARP family transcriptional activator
MGREQVMQMLWPGLDFDLAANRLNGAVHELRQILEPTLSRPSSSRLLRLERDTFVLADNSLIWVDAEAFEQLLKDAKMCGDIQQVEHLLEEAAALYQGNYLPEELYSEWAVPRRDALQRAWVDLQLRLTQIKITQEAYVSAIEILDRLRTADPTNETALQQLMTLLTHLDRRAEALEIYKQYRSMLKRDYESQPLPETAVLYDKLRRGHIPPLCSTGGIEQAQTGRDEHSADPDPWHKSDNDKPYPQRSPTSGSITPSVPDTQPADQEDTDDTLSYTRPLFQLGHRNQSPLIGREQERQRMRQLLFTIEQTNAKTEMSRSSPGHFMLLIGEPGIGKTRMAEELGLEAYNCGWTVAWSRSYEQESAIPYHPWTEILRTLLEQGQAPAQNLSPLKLDQLCALLPELADYIHPAQPSPGVSPEHRRLHLWETILGLLTTISKFHPLLLVFDDLHWADDSSIQLLTYLTHHLQGQRVLLIGTCRDGELAPQHKLRPLTAELQRKHAITMIAIHPLTPAQIGLLVSYLPEKLIPSIQMQSSGNPLFAEELARFVYRRETSHHTSKQEQPDPFSLTQKIERENVSSSIGVGPAQGAGSAQGTIPTDSALPDAIAAVLERRLHRLSEECHALLGKAAVLVLDLLRDSFELEQLLPMAPEHNEDAILDLLEDALHAGLLVEEAKGAHVIYHFWHPLITSYLYNHLSAARRALFQRTAATLSTTSKSGIHTSNQSGKS